MQSAPAPHYLSQREPWQLDANTGGAKVRDAAAATLRAFFEVKYAGQFSVETEPADLQQMYYWYDYQLNPERYARPAVPGPEDVWYDNERKQFLTQKAGAGGEREAFAMSGGCTPDIKVRCLASGRAYFLECKNQGDAGNAHERCAKYATPSVVRLIQSVLGGVEYHPIGYIFSGAMVKKRKYALELQATYAFAPGHLLLWDREAAGGGVPELERMGEMIAQLLLR